MRFAGALEKWRVRHGEMASGIGDDFGAFHIPGPNGQDLFIVASPGEANEEIPWEHVSVSLKNRCPNWIEMCFIKDLFWEPEDVVMQLHVARSEWISFHPFCLHLWRPLNEKIPLPPSIAVGPKEVIR